MNKKKALAVILSCGLISAMVLGGSLAYLTDNEAHTNTVQVSGNIRIDLVEEHWDTTDTDSDGIPDAAERTVPNQVIPKDPKVLNTGENPAYVFLRMTVPVKDVTRVADNGVLLQKNGTANYVQQATTPGSGNIYHEPQELFFFKRTADNYKDHVNHFYTPNDGNTTEGWIRLGIEEFNTDTDETGAYKSAKSGKVGQAVYVFGWNQVVAPRTETGVLYDVIQIKNIIENEVASDQIQNIKLEAFGIQSDNIINSQGQAVATTGYRTRAELTEIYDIFVAQNGQVNTAPAEGNKGDFIWNTWQDAEHGQAEKEAHINNERDINNTSAHNATTFAQVNVDGSTVDGVWANRTNLLVGQTAQVQYATSSVRDGYTVVPVYESSNPEVASVDRASGLVTANKAGDAMITVTIDPGVQGTNGTYAIAPVKKSIEIHVWNDSRDQTPDTNVELNNNTEPQGTTEPNVTP